MIECPTYTTTIFIGGDYAKAKEVCRGYCMAGLCVTIEPTEYVYTGGCEAGVRVGLINYARFPADDWLIFDHALKLARMLREALSQHSFSIVATDKTVFETTRSEEGLAGAIQLARSALMADEATTLEALKSIIRLGSAR